MRAVVWMHADNHNIPSQAPKITCSDVFYGTNVLNTRVTDAKKLRHSLFLGAAVFTYESKSMSIRTPAEIYGIRHAFGPRRRNSALAIYCVGSIVNERRFIGADSQQVFSGREFNVPYTFLTTKRRREEGVCKTEAPINVHTWTIKLCSGGGGGFVCTAAFTLKTPLVNSLES